MALKYYLFLLLLILISTISGCHSRVENAPETTRVDNQFVQLAVNLANDGEVYSVGEFIALSLQISNEREIPIKIRNFSFSGLAFSEPNSMHLIGPDGRDLFLPHRRSPLEMDDVSPIQISARDEKWIYLPLSSYLHLRQPGRYTFWLEVVDDEGNRYRSNQLGFKLLTIEPSVPTKLIELFLQSGSFSNAGPVRVKAVFKNNSDQAVTFLKPQDGSFAGWINPIYEFTVIDEVGRSLPHPARSATLVEPVYDNRTQFTLFPGASYEQELIPPPLVFQEPGKYRVQLTYIVHENAVRMGVVTDQMMNWEKEMFTGLIESNDIIVTVEP